MLPLLGLLGSCSEKEEIVFAHEKQMFPSRTDAILLEVIMPQGTTVTDEIYIVGDFNGGEEAAVGQSTWLMEKAPESDIKWGIYLNPATFVGGKTLADGFYFVSKEQGIERTVFNEVALHKVNTPVGGWTNVYANRWESYFTPSDPGAIEHDGYAVFIDDYTGWEGIALYAWGDGEAFGGWPGAQVTGTVVIGKTTWKYFDIGAANEGMSLNLIFNNNNGGTQFDAANIVADRDYYFSITSGAAVEVTPREYSGHTVYILDNTGWEGIALYAWGDAEAFGGWPGMQVTGTTTINGMEYKYFDLGDEATGMALNLIFNNNNNGKQIESGDLAVTIDKDYYYLLNSDLSFEVVDPLNPPTPEPPAEE
jgi:hypothetical protein